MSVLYDMTGNVVYNQDDTIEKLVNDTRALQNDTIRSGITAEVTVPASGWYRRYCTVAINGVSENSKISVVPVAASESVFKESEIYCSARGNGYIVLCAATEPAADITIEVSYSIPNELSVGQINARINGYILGSMRYQMLSAPPTGDYSAGSKSGLPYSSAGAEDKFIGINTSLYTFLCVAKNPRSMLYTTASKSYTGYAYYGTVCTSLVCAAWGLPILITTACFEKGNLITKLGTVNSITDYKVGDMLLYGGHACMIVDVSDDLSRIVLSESKYWSTTIDTYDSLAAFRSAWGRYQVCRYADIEGVKYIMGDSFINPASHAHSEINFPDIMTNFGDKCILLPTDSINLDVLDSTGYTSITVYKDNEVLSTHEIANTITLGTLATGDYKAVMSGNGVESACYWTIADVSASLNDSTLTFTSTNCTPVWVTGHPAQVTDADGHYTQWNNMKQESQITEAEAEAGTKNIATLLADPDVTGLIKVHFAHKYGVVTAKIAL